MRHPRPAAGRAAVLPDAAAGLLVGCAPEAVTAQGQDIQRLYNFLQTQSLVTKRQAVPGRTSSFDLTFDQPGVFWGRCAAYCGLAHADMVLKVRVLPADQFPQWLDQQEATGDQAQPR